MSGILGNLHVASIIAVGGLFVVADLQATGPDGSRPDAGEVYVIFQ